MAQSFDNQKSKRDTPSIAIKEASSAAVGSVKKPLIKDKSVDKRSAKKLHFSLVVEQVARRPRTRASAKRLLLDLTLVQVVEISKSAHEEVETGERDQRIKDLQDQIGQAHLMIT